MANSKSPPPRVTRADRPPSTTHHSSHNISPHPPRSRKRYPSLKMALPPGLDTSSPPALSSRPSLRRSSKGSIGSDRPPTPVSKSSIKDSHSSAQLAVQSALLHEKLQQERRHEVERSLTRLADEMGAADESIAALATPTRCATADGKRPELIEGTVDGKAKGYSIKEMGQTMSTLHKQNFDLKLELFHRRERQAVLEQKIEALEADRANAEQSNVKLMQELEKRDKAVEEAVQMIVSLEAHTELLLREREMTRQVEANKTLLSQMGHSPSQTLVNHGAIPRLNDNTVTNEKHSLGRMPSFLSEHTENSENLRNVYLDPKSSYLSLSKMDSRAGNNGFVSPSMSVLSESSFLSIYGQGTTNDISSTPKISSTIQSRLIGSGQRSASLPIRDYTPGGSKPQRGERLGLWDGAKATMQTGHAQSPSQGLDKLDTSLQAFSQNTPSGKEIKRSATVRPNVSQVLPRVRKDNERSARKVSTDDSGMIHQRLPPTPDTMTSSILNGQSQVSDSSLRRNPLANDPTRYPVLSRLTLDQTGEVEPGHWRFKSSDVAQPPSITAFTGRQEAPGVTAYYENRQSTLRRPRSADETTISRHKSDWDSCSDVDDLCSEASSFDYWMKEGLQPGHGGTSKARTRTFSSQFGSSRDPPDLFSFPSDGQGWQNNEVLGALQGTGSLGVKISRTPAAFDGSEPALTAPPKTGLQGPGPAGSHFTRLQGAAAAPPPAPYRRSSLKARTSAPGTPTTACTPWSHGKPSNVDQSHNRSISGHVPSSSNQNGWPASNITRSKSPNPPAQPQTQHPDLTAQKRHYPPHASQPQATPRPRSRGITSLFRRSLGSATPQPSASVPPSASQSPFAPPPATNKDASPLTVGFPVWERRNNLVDNGSRATPPPIMRNRGDTRRSMESDDGDDVEGVKLAGSLQMARDYGGDSSSSVLGSGLSKPMPARDGGVALTPASDQASDQERGMVQSSQGHGRRWFNLSRVTNHHKNASGGT